MRIPSDSSGKIRLLEKARTDYGLQAMLNAEGSSSFGAFPLGLEGETLVVAVPRWADLRLYPLLGLALGRPVRPVPMEPDLVMSFIAKVHLSGEMPNFHTFREEDFVREENLSQLMTGKVEAVPEPSLEVPGDSAALLDLALWSELRNLDRSEGDPRVFPEELDVPFAGRGSCASVFGGELQKSERALVKLSYVYEGMEHRHGFRSGRIENLPFVLHPTELQLVSIGPGGEAGFWVFDRVERPGAGEAACAYHFLHFGNRYRRELKVRVLGSDVVLRRSLKASEGQRWTIEDFERWFGAPYR